jgi:quinol monooxygenase YgiN
VKTSVVQLIITITTRPGRVHDYLAAFSALAPRVRQEKGCIEYDIYLDSDDPRFDNEVRPDTVVLCEKWESVEALQHHTRSSAALVEFRQAVKDIKFDSRYRLLIPAISE